jgi:hypothetical protein
MPTCRVIIADALRALKVNAPGDDSDADQLVTGLEALQNLILEIHNGRGPLLDVDVVSDYIPGENQRLRVQAGDTITVTLPNAIAIGCAGDPYDYGFSGSGLAPPIGTTASVDNIAWRQPRDGARIEIVGTTNGLYLYRADTNTWMPAYGLTLDTESPFNARYAGPLGALLAERLMEPLSVNEPSPGLVRRVARANSALLMQSGTHRAPVQASYF